MTRFSGPKADSRLGSFGFSSKASDQCSMAASPWIETFIVGQSYGSYG